MFVMFNRLSHHALPPLRCQQNRPTLPSYCLLISRLLNLLALRQNGVNPLTYYNCSFECMVMNASQLVASGWCGPSRDSSLGHSWSWDKCWSCASSRHDQKLFWAAVAAGCVSLALHSGHTVFHNTIDKTRNRRITWGDLRRSSPIMNPLLAHHRSWILCIDHHRSWIYTHEDKKEWVIAMRWDDRIVVALSSIWNV